MLRKRSLVGTFASYDISGSLSVNPFWHTARAPTYINDSGLLPCLPLISFDRASPPTKVVASALSFILKSWNQPREIKHVGAGLSNSRVDRLLRRPDYY